METIKWHKVICSFYAQTLGFDERKRGCWEALTNFIKHNIGFNYTITAMYDEMPKEVVEIVYDKNSTCGYKVINPSTKEAMQTIKVGDKYSLYLSLDESNTYDVYDNEGNYIGNICADWVMDNCIDKDTQEFDEDGLEELIIGQIGE